MTPIELLNLAEERLLALDKEVREGGNFATRTAVVQQLHELATAKAQLELVRLQAAEVVLGVRRNNPSALDYRLP